MLAYGPRCLTPLSPTPSSQEEVSDLIENIRRHKTSDRRDRLWRKSHSAEGFTAKTEENKSLTNNWSLRKKQRFSAVRKHSRRMCFIEAHVNTHSQRHRYT